MTNYIGHCAECDYALMAEGTQITESTDWRGLSAGEARRVAPYGVYGRCPQHHRAFRLSKIRGVLNPAHRCDSRCLNAKGRDCSCACGGANHGRGHQVDYTPAQARIPNVIPEDKVSQPPVDPEDQNVPEPMTAKQRSLIEKLIIERTMSDESRRKAQERLPNLTKSQASGWISRLLSLPRV